MLCSFLERAENVLVSIDSQGRAVVSVLSFVSPEEDLRVQTVFNIAVEGISEVSFLCVDPKPF